MATYRYALGNDNCLVDVDTLDPSTRKNKAPYTCMGCGDYLIPNLGEIKEKHFSHKGGAICSDETYLHRLGKQVFFERYQECLKTGKPYELVLDFPTSCNRYHDVFGETCDGEKSYTFDLTKFFKKIYLEKKHDSFIADILITTEDESEVIFFEIAVTHKCETEKIESGKRIIEIDIVSDFSIKELYKNKLTEHMSGVRLYNFKKELRKGDVCKGKCPKKIQKFSIFENGTSELFTGTLEEMENSKSLFISIYSKVIGLSEGGAPYKRTYIKSVRDAYFDNIPIQNCYLCKYHGLTDSHEVFCKINKKTLDSNYATGCKTYKPVSTREESNKVSENNREYLQNIINSRFKRAKRKMYRDGY